MSQKIIDSITKAPDDAKFHIEVKGVLKVFTRAQALKHYQGKTKVGDKKPRQKAEQKK